MDASAQKGPGKYPIRVVARLTGIPIDTLRAWERRYGAVEPGRDDRGRLYAEPDVQKLKLLRRLVERGHAIGRIANMEDAELSRLLEAGLEPRDRDGKADQIDLRALFDAIDRYDMSALDRQVGKLAAVLSARELVYQVVLPLMREVGSAWERGQFTVAQEHLATGAMRNLLGSLVRVQAPRDGRASVVFATPAGERHEIGILAAAMLGATAGLGVVYLGADLPAEDVVEAVRRTGARVVVLGMTVTGDVLPEQIARSITQVLPRGVDVLVGGAATNGRVEALREADVTVLRDFEALENAYRGLGARL
jgi:MerR family transcriptional regulator, light-induced transcriptional regulator